MCVRVCVCPKIYVCMSVYMDVRMRCKLAAIFSNQRALERQRFRGETHTDTTNKCNNNWNLHIKYSMIILTYCQNMVHVFCLSEPSYTHTHTHTPLMTVMLVVLQLLAQVHNFFSACVCVCACVCGAPQFLSLSLPLPLPSACLCLCGGGAVKSGPVPPSNVHMWVVTAAFQICCDWLSTFVVKCHFRKSLSLSLSLSCMVQVRTKTIRID